ncbi:MAG TPA: bifunctional serine/threonine-protein kinase/formylglycine-generating enzyme family protein [Anaerolineaceae bacterium]
MVEIIGQVIDERYQVLARLGEGGMAAVYRAYDTRLKKEVAVKLISLEDVPASAHARLQARFEIEAQKTAALRHPHIITVTDYGRHEGAPFLVMDYLPGGTLKDYLARRGQPLTYWEAARLLAPVARALAYAHSKEIIHRDVKPSNILLGEDGQPVLADFGIAKVLSEDSGMTLTGTGLGIGTAEYMPPEQWNGKPVYASDQYALGMTFYYLVTRRTAFQETTPQKIVTRLLTEPPPSPRQLNPALPLAVERVILRTLEKDPAHRYPDMNALAFELERLASAGAHSHAPTLIPQITSDEGFTPVKPSTPLRREERSSTTRPKPSPRQVPIWLAGAGGLALLAGLCIGLVWLGSRVLPGFFATRTPALTITPHLLTPALNLTPTLTLAPSRTFTPAFTPTFTLTSTPSLTPTFTLTPKDGDSIVSPKDGTTLLYVSAGEFKMGSADADKDAIDDEKPQHSVTLDAFWIDKTEVTNAMYARCVAAGACAAPNRMGSNSRSSYYGNNAYANYPVITVDWNQAKTYCEWAGRRLPTEAEWEKVARGTDERIYPWGNTSPDCSMLNFSGQNNGCVGDTTEVGKYPKGASPYGALDMAGNVWEWVADWYGSYSSSPSKNPQGSSSGQNRVLRGGSWNDGARDVRAAVRGGSDPGSIDLSFGFRCAVSP